MTEKLFIWLSLAFFPKKNWINQAMVLLKSNDLVNGSSTVVNIPENFDEFYEVHRMWEPQTIYDED
jgi:hypothetical protein